MGPLMQAATASEAAATATERATAAEALATTAQRRFDSLESDAKAAKLEASLAEVARGSREKVVRELTEQVRALPLLVSLLHTPACTVLASVY